jgi:thiamine-phosphate pyrophosphorylase
MRRRQTVPSQWLIVTGADGVDAVRRLPRGSGVLVIGRLSTGALRRLKTIVRSRDLRVAIEGRQTAARVHNLGELRRALLARTPLVLLSPIYPTATHPEWAPIPRMRAAAFARLGERRLVALGGMNSKRYAAVERLGFIGWAGISAFRT